MSNFVMGTIFGIIVSTIGFTGIAHVLDRAVAVTKVEARQIEQIGK